MSNKTKMWIAIYAIWFILNFSFIFIGESDGTNHFFPFRHGEFEWDLDYYDFGEFCVYALLIPAVIVGLHYISLWKKED